MPTGKKPLIAKAANPSRGPHAGLRRKLDPTPEEIAYDKAVADRVAESAKVGSARWRGENAESERSTLLHTIADKARDVALKELPEDEAKTIELKGVILTLKAKAANRHQIAQVMAREYGLSRKRTWELLTQVLGELAHNLREESPYSKAEQVHRLRSIITELHNPGSMRRRVLQANGKYEVQLVARPKKYGDIFRFERLLAEIEGNLEPGTINVNLTQNTMQVFANLTEERREELLRRGRERLRLAEIATSSNLLPAKVETA